MSVSVFGFVHVSVLHGGAKREYQIPWSWGHRGLELLNVCSGSRIWVL